MGMLARLLGLSLSLCLSTVLLTLLRADKESSAHVVMDRTVIAANYLLHYHCKLFFFMQIVKKQ